MERQYFFNVPTTKTCTFFLIGVILNKICVVKVEKEISYIISILMSAHLRFCIERHSRRVKP